MILITPLPGVTTVKPGSATKPFPGVEAAVYDESGKEVGPGGGGYLVLRRPWPAMLRGIFKDDQRYRETYWSKYPDVYFAGDGARIDEDGDFWLMGRVDDVMNVSGHRISTIEVESALVDTTVSPRRLSADAKTSTPARRSSPSSPCEAARRARRR
jgi:acetyl-CoA synthetase